jgi:hypothetical protein
MTDLRARELCNFIDLNLLKVRIKSLKSLAPTDAMSPAGSRHVAMGL